MSDVEATPVGDSAPEVQDITPAEVDWQKRFTDTQAEYTKQQQALKEAQSVWEDENALIAKIGEQFPHLLEDESEPVEEDDSSFDDEPQYMTKAEFAAWQEQQSQQTKAEKNQQQFTEDLNRFVGDRELDKFGEGFIRSQQYKGPDDLKDAVNAYFDHLDSLGGSKRKKRPSSGVQQGGQPATGVPDYSEMSRDQINQAMVERARAMDSQT